MERWLEPACGYALSKEVCEAKPSWCLSAFGRSIYRLAQVARAIPGRDEFWVQSIIKFACQHLLALTPHSFSPERISSVPIHPMADPRIATASRDFRALRRIRNEKRANRKLGGQRFTGRPQLPVCRPPPHFKSGSADVLTDLVQRCPAMLADAPGTRAKFPMIRSRILVCAAPLSF